MLKYTDTFNKSLELFQKYYNEGIQNYFNIINTSGKSYNHEYFLIFRLSGISY